MEDLFTEQQHMQKCKKFKGYLHLPSLTTTIHNENTVASVQSVTQKYIPKNCPRTWKNIKQTKPNAKSQSKTKPNQTQQSQSNHLFL